MITIKGFRQGLLIVFSGPPDEPWLTRLRELESRLNANASFFKGGSVVFDVKAMPLTEDDLSRSVTLLQTYEVNLWAVLSQDEATQARVRAFGLADRLTPPETKPVGASASVSTSTAQTASTDDVAHVVDSAGDSAGDSARQTDRLTSATQEELPSDGTDGLLVRRRVRSGQTLRHPGHIVVIGDVNPGAQLIAGGDIIVWGKLQGTAHAGALGDDSAVICALDMSPSFVRIADATSRSPSSSSQRSERNQGRVVRLGDPHNRNKSGKASKAEMARLIEQQIVFTAWDGSA